MARPRDEAWVLLLCESCGRPFSLSARQGRAIRQEKRSANCKMCRTVHRRIVVEPQDYVFWLERFSLAEIVDMAEDSWGHPDSWTDDWRRDIEFAPAPPL